MRNRPSRIVAQRGGLALEAAGEPERAAVVADLLLDVDAHRRGAVDHLMPRAHGVGIAVRGSGAPRPRTTRAGMLSALAQARCTRCACSSAFSRVGTSHQIAASPRSSAICSARGPALAGALPAGDQHALALLRQPVDAVLRQHLALDPARDRALAPPDLGLLLGGRRVEVERRHQASPSAANAAARRSAISRRASA